MHIDDGNETLTVVFHLCSLCFLSPQQEDCEKAYFKMDNVLIDDRRIHVDFSQSVAKIKWKGKGHLTIHICSLFLFVVKGKHVHPL